MQRILIECARIVAAQLYSKKYESIASNKSITFYISAMGLINAAPPTRLDIGNMMNGAHQLQTFNPNPIFPRTFVDL